MNPYVCIMHGHSSGVGFSCDASLSGYSTDHGVHIFFFVFVFCFVMQLQRCYVCCVCFELYVGRQGSVVFSHVLCVDSTD